MVDMPLRRRLLLILPSLVAGFGEAHHKQGLVPCKHLARRELFDEIEDKGAWPGEHVLPLNLGRGWVRCARAGCRDMLEDVWVRLVRIRPELVLLRRQEIQEFCRRLRGQTAVRGSRGERRLTVTGLWTDRRQ